MPERIKLAPARLIASVVNICYGNSAHTHTQVISVSIISAAAAAAGDALIHYGGGENLVSVIGPHQAGRLPPFTVYHLLP